MYDAKNFGSKCRTRFEYSLPNQGGIMSYHYMSDGNHTFQESVAGRLPLIKSNVIENLHLMVKYFSP